MFTRPERQAGRFLTAGEDRVDHVHVMGVVVFDIGGQHRVAQHMDVFQLIYQSGEVIHIAQNRWAVRFGFCVKSRHRSAGIGEIDRLCMAMHVVFAFAFATGIDIKFLGGPSEDILHQSARKTQAVVFVHHHTLG